MIGCYLLVLFLKENCKLKIGSLGFREFKKGYYVYVGSAFGKNISIEKRVNRHKRLVLEKTGKTRWHVDYLLIHENVKLVKVIPFESNKKIECKVSRKLEKIADDVVIGFGSTDCKNRCLSHLYYFKLDPTKTVLKKLEEQVKKEAGV